MISVGMSTRARSLRKSSCHVGTQARLAVADAPAATFQLAWTACSLMRLPRKTSVLKKFLKNSVKKDQRDDLRRNPILYVVRPPFQVAKALQALLLKALLPDV